MPIRLVCLHVLPSTAAPTRSRLHLEIYTTILISKTSRLTSGYINKVWLLNSQPSVTFLLTHAIPLHSYICVTICFTYKDSATIFQATTKQAYLPVDSLEARESTSVLRLEAALTVCRLWVASFLVAAPDGRPEGSLGFFVCVPGSCSSGANDALTGMPRDCLRDAEKRDMSPKVYFNMIWLQCWIFTRQNWKHKFLFPVPEIWDSVHRWTIEPRIEHPKTPLFHLWNGENERYLRDGSWLELVLVYLLLRHRLLYQLWGSIVFHMFQPPQCR